MAKGIYAGADAATVAGERGWVIAYTDGDRLLSIEFASRLESVVERAELTAVDIPIGLPGDEGVALDVTGTRRQADVQSRALVGVRRSSVFWTHPVAAFEARSYSEARRQHPALSAQSFALGARILEVRQLANRLGPLIIEYHPEVSFRMLAEEPLQDSKKSWNGQAIRRNLLSDAGIEFPAMLDRPAGRVCPDDILDAAVGALTAAAVAQGRFLSLGADPAQRTRRGVIWAPAGERLPASAEP